MPVEGETPTPEMIQSNMRRLLLELRERRSQPKTYDNRRNQLRRLGLKVEDFYPFRDT